MQELLAATFDKTRVRERRYQTQTEEPYFQFINYKSVTKGFFSSSFFAYEKGRIGQVIEERFDQEQIEPEALPPQNAADGTERQFLDGKLFFVCFKNHLVLAHDQHLKGRHLEAYLDAMIRKRVAGFPKEQRFTLERTISEKQRKKIRGVRTVHLSAPLQYEVRPSSSGGDNKGMVTLPKGPAWEAIQAFVKDKLDLTQFSTNGFIHPKDIEVTVSLAWKKRKRGERTSDQLDALANTFRHIDDELEIELETQSGPIKHNELRLEERKSVAHRDDMPQLDDIFAKMIEWYDHLNTSGDI